MPRSTTGRKTCRLPPDCVIRAAQTRNSPACPMASWLPMGYGLMLDSVIDPLHEPVLASAVVIELAQQRVVQHDLPVLAEGRPVPPRRLYLPVGDRVDQPCERTGDRLRRSAWSERDIDRGGRGEKPRHAGFGCPTTSPKRSCSPPRAAGT